MARVKWKRTRKGIVFVEKKTWGERLQSITFMQTSIFLFVLELLLTLGCFAWAIATDGGAQWPVTLAGFLVFCLSISGLWVTCYGHFTVEAESRIPWKAGIYTHSVMLALMVAVYVLGAVLG